MKKLILLFILIGCTAQLSAQKSSLHGFNVFSIKDSLISMKKYYGKKILIVNTASFCSYTPQYEQLENLYQAYKHKNFEIVGFPSNDFGNQDPHSDSVIDIFCTENYGVTFQMMSKVQVVLGDTAPIYKWLQLKALNETKNVNVDWNFNKFLINESGEWVAHHSSPVLPFDTIITNWINRPTSLIGINENSFAAPANIAVISSQNPATTSFELTLLELLSSNVTADIYSIDGHHVKNIFHSNQVQAGEKHSTEISDLSGGIYFVRIENEGRRQNLKLIVLR